MSLEDFFNGEKFTLVKKEEYEDIQDLIISMILSLSEEGYDMPQIREFSTRYVNEEDTERIGLSAIHLYMYLYENDYIKFVNGDIEVDTSYKPQPKEKA